jgi:polysaccharide biosynthesis transport protein
MSAAMTSADRSYLDLVDYLRIFRRRRVWLIGAVALGLVLALGHAFFARPMYVSTARVLVAETNVDPLAGPSPVDLETEREVVLSTPVANIARGAMGSAKRSSELLRNVSVEIPGETQVLEIAYRAPTPELAKEGAAAFAAGYLEYRRDRAQELSRESVETIELQISELLADVTSLTEQIERAVRGSEERARAVATRHGLKSQIAELRTTLAGLTGVRTDPGDVIGAPTLPESPASPSLPLDLAVGLGGGAVVGTVLALFRERTDRRIHGHLDLEKVLGVPTLAFVPHVPAWKHQAKPVLVSRDEPHHQAGEGYRLLRTHVLLAAHMARGAPQVIVVTSALPGEGKTTTVANMGVVLANSEKETIVVSADFRRPRLHGFFGMGNGPGLSDVLVGAVRLEDAIQPTDVEHLSVVTSGGLGTGGVELLQPENIREFVKDLMEVSGGFDFVVVDAPPLLPVADTLMILPAVDQVVFVVDASRTEEPVLRRSRELLEQVDAEVLGSFLNNYQPPAYEGYEAYGYGYSQDGGDGERRRIAGVTVPGRLKRGLAEISGARRRQSRGR